MKKEFDDKSLRQKAVENQKKKTAKEIVQLTVADSLKLMQKLEDSQRKLGMQYDEMQKSKEHDFQQIRLLHELEVHKLELEMQNDELNKSRLAAEEIAKKYSILYNSAPTGYFTLSNEGIILDLNHCGAQMLQKEKSELIHTQFCLFVSNNTKPYFQLFLDKVFITSKIENSEITLLIDNRPPLYVHLTGIVDNNQQCLVTVVDITKRKLAEEELVLKNVIFDTSIVANCITDLKGEITEVNHSFYLTYGYKNKFEVIGKNFTEFTFCKTEGEEILKSLYENSQWKGEFKARDVKGETFVAQGTAAVVRDKYGEVIGFQSSIIDVTTQKEAQDALYLSEQKFRSIFENTQDIFFQIDLSGKIIDISPSIELYTSISRDKYVGFSIINSHADQHKAQKLFNSIVYNNHQLNDFEIKVNAPNGELKYLSVNAKLIFDRSEKPSHIDGSMRDITQRKLAEESLKNSQLLLNSSVESPKDMIILSIDKNYNYLFFNTFHKDIMKSAYNKEVSIGVNLLDCISNKDDRKRAKVNYNIALSGKSHITIEQYGDLQKRIYETRYNPIINDKKEVIGATAFAADITERINNERALKENEHKYRELVENSPDAILIYIDSKIVFANKQALLLIGASSLSQLIGKSVLEFIHPDSHYTIVQRMRCSSKVVVPSLEEKFVKIDGTVVDVEVKGTNIKIENKDAVQLIVSDITERKKAQVDLLESEENYRFMFANNPQPMFIYDLTSLEFLEANNSAVSNYGFSREEFLSMTLKDILPHEDMPTLINDFELEQGNNQTVSQWRHVTKNNNIIFVEVFAHTIKYKGRKARHILINDITERKQLENALMARQQELKNFAVNLQNVREEERVLLAREIHDELAQILIAVKIDIGIMKKKLSKDINNITAEGFINNFNNIFSMVDNTIHSSRKIMSGLRSEVLELLGFIETMKLYSKEFEERHKIKFTLNFKEDIIELDSIQSIALFRIYQEILSNVSQHSNATEVLIFLGIVNNMLVFEVTDNGNGFDINESPKPDAQGLIGMQERVYALNGKLLIDAIPDKGTSVRVEIPYLKV